LQFIFQQVYIQIPNIAVFGCFHKNIPENISFLPAESGILSNF